MKPKRSIPSLLLFALPLLLAAPAAHAIQDCALDGEHVNPANGNTTAGKTGLMRCVDRDTKQLVREEELRNGKSVGIVRHYRDGKLMKEYSVNEKGNRQGRAREFSPGGQVVRDETYENGSNVGLVRSFFESGAPQRATFHGTGGREQASVEFTEKGQLASLHCGEKPALAPVVDDAKLCGFSGGAAPVEFFSSRGQLRSRVLYANGKRVKAESFFDNGKPSQVDETADGRLTSVRYSAEGVKRSEIVSAVTERGSRYAELGRYREIALGTHKSYAENGSLAGESVYDDKGRLSRQRTWDETGKLVRDEEVFEDGSRKAFAR